MAAQAHAGQVDKAGQPYILHPLRVMMSVADYDAKIVAVLHDVIEDTSMTAEDPAGAGFSRPALRPCNLSPAAPGKAIWIS